MEIRALVELDEGVLWDRWERLCARVGSVETDDQVALSFEMVRTLYATPVRAYHNLAHIGACLEVFDSVRGLAEERDAVEAGLWLHHAVYFPGGFDNDEQSGFVAGTVLGLIGASGVFVGTVKRLMVATRHDGSRLAGDDALTADIDLAVLGAGEGEYEVYRSAVYEEYAFADRVAFAEGRLAFLDRQLEKERIYWTPLFYGECEKRARWNMEHERDALLRELGLS